MLRPEAELLLCAARARPDAKTAARLTALLRGRIDWPYLLRLAQRHRVASLLCRRLETIGPHAIPAAVHDELEAHFGHNQRRNLFMTAQLSHILQLLEANGIPAISYKGPSLAVSAYGSLALREFDDLDLLVPKRDLLRAKELLVSDGYRPQAALTRSQEQWLLESQHPYSLVRDGGPVYVELHWEISPRYIGLPMAPERLWESQEPVLVAGVSVPALSPEILLPSLCEHGAKHSWERLEWICDVAELTQTSRALDWDRIVRETSRSGARRMLALGLFLARSLLGAPLPDEVWKRVESDHAVEALAAGVRRRLFQEPGRPPGVFESTLFQLRLLEHWGDRARFCRLALTTPTIADWKRVELPPALSFLYYPLRVVRLLRGSHRVH